MVDNSMKNPSWTKLQAAWSRFTKRISNVRSETRMIVSKVEEKQQEKKIKNLREQMKRL